MLKKIDQFFAQALIKLIKIYQKTLSPDHSPLGKLFPHHGCRFHPTCSMYAVEVLEKKGFAKGAPKAVWRVLRCNPWHEGGIDLPK